MPVAASYARIVRVSERVGSHADAIASVLLIRSGKCNVRGTRVWLPLGHADHVGIQHVVDAFYSIIGVRVDREQDLRRRIATDD